MVRHTGSPTCIVHADMTFTRSKVKVKVTDFVNFRKLHYSTFCIGAQNWWLITTVPVWDLVYSCSAIDFWISLPVGGHMTSKFAKWWYHQNQLRFISTLPAARSLWLWLQVGRNKPCTLAAMTVNTLAGLFMAPQRSRCGHYIFALWFLSFFFFFPRLISAVEEWMPTILLHMVRRSVNLECRSEMCCTRLAGNTGRKNNEKITIWAPLHNFVGLNLRN